MGIRNPFEALRRGVPWLHGSPVEVVTPCGRAGWERPLLDVFEHSHTPRQSQETNMLQLIPTLVAAVFTALFLTSPPLALAAAVNPDGLTTYADCALERIDTQLVRCDNLTGGNVSAPDWIPEQK
ncbi:hypothetical protein PUN71_022050 [Arthrobacter sp. NQ7]|uniref:hypothetical protein n=1 Tax=Arthrobacter sp. NQ7 TaxID=3032303 RepID=UPI0024104A6A|nr:hypothetical protein [Arthrobacter sp. NQ7]MDJ0459894.1 hypothetical protein [Arthrobacter sp. NQ7]